MRIGLSGFLFEEDYRRQSVSFEQFCRIARSAGYDGVELRRTQITPDSPADEKGRMRAVLSEQGLEVVCLTARGMPSGGQERDDYLQRYLALCQEFGCGLLKAGGEPAWLGEAAARAEEFGVRLATNTHLNTPLETVAGIAEYLREIGTDKFGLLYDCMHLAIAEQDYLGGIETFCPRIGNVLIQCVRPGGEGEEAVISREGRGFVRTRIDQEPVQDWPAVFEKLKRLNYEGWITVIENGWPADQREEVAYVTARYVREVWEKVE